MPGTCLRCGDDVRGLAHPHNCPGRDDTEALLMRLEDEAIAGVALCPWCDTPEARGLHDDDLCASVRECERCREGEHGNVAKGRCLCCSTVVLAPESHGEALIR